MKHRVRRGPKPSIIKLPATYEGRVFTDENGTQYDVLPIPVTDWPLGGYRDTTEPAKLHLRKPS